jgi:gluconokinase
MVVVLMGVSGSGKTTVGQILAKRLGWPFLDADDFHPAANVEKMRGGTPLTDEDRKPWLDAIKRRIDEAYTRRENVVLACSALKHAYQDYLEREGNPEFVEYVQLTGSEELIAKRLAERKGHFMNPKLLHSQFEALEPPAHSLQVDITPPPEEIAAEIQRKLKLKPA